MASLQNTATRKQVSLPVGMKNYYNHLESVGDFVVELKHQIESNINRIEVNRGINSSLALVLFVDGAMDYLSQWDLRVDPYQEVVIEYIAIKCF